MRYKATTIYYIIVLSWVCFGPAFSQSPSEFALIRRDVFQNPPIERLTKGVTNSKWGIDLFGKPRGSAQDYIFTPGNELLTGMSFNVDYSWCRLIYIECLDNWVRAQGSYGTGNGQFSRPRSIDVIVPNDEQYYSYYYYIYVLDNGNNRISKLTYDWVNQIIYNNGYMGMAYLSEPIDFDLNNNFDFWPHDNDYFWVMDGSNQLKRIGINGSLYGTYGSGGCNGGVWEFCQPTAVVSGRSFTLMPPYDKCANTDHLYIADTGNDRIVRLIKTHGAESVLWYDEVPIAPGSNIIDLETDNFGHVWAVDIGKDQIIKYTYDMFPLCAFAGTGIGSTQFIQPVNIRNTGGFRGSGNMYVTESWTDTTGGNYFCIGTDIVDFEVNSDTSLTAHYIYFVLIDQSKINAKIYNQDAIEVKTLLDGVYFSGEFNMLWDGTDNSSQQLPTGNYRLVIEDTCSYWSATSDEPANVVTKEAWIRHLGYLCGDANSDQTVDILDMVYLINYKYKVGPAPVPLEAGNINCDVSINILDIVYIITYIYKNGPAPCCDACCY